jgi:hypothetical protein
VEEIHMSDITFALARISRFTGHTEFYSVAQHSVLCSWQAAQEYHDLDLSFEVLMHDAHEVYTGDMARPMKEVVSGYREFEERMKRLVAERFKLTYPHREEIALVDLRMLATEQRALFHMDLDWGLGDVEPYPLEILSRLWGPEEAERQFSNQVILFMRAKHTGRII